MQRKPLMFIETPADGGGSTTPAAADPDSPSPEAGATTPDGTPREDAFAHRIAKEREKWEKDNAEKFAKAAEYEAKLEAEKTESQKAIEAANKRAEEALAEATKTKREIALTKAGIAEDEWEDFADWTPAQIAKYGEKAAAVAAEPKADPSDGRPTPNLRIAGKPDAEPTVIPAGVVIRK